MGGVMLAYYSIATNMALYLEQNSIGGATLAGTVVSLNDGWWNDDKFISRPN